MTAVKNTLYIRRLPAELTPEEKEDFLTHFGAISVRCLPDSGRMKHSAYAVFSSEQTAEQALVRLHQLELFGNRLQVQFAYEQEKKHFPHVASFKKQVTDNGDVKQAESLKKGSDCNTKIEMMQRGINNISTLFGLNYPKNPKLRYQYPRPTKTILTNIIHALASVPKFYVQVLHLMNKLNLPPPFGAPTQAPPTLDSLYEKNSRKRSRKERIISNMNEEDLETTSESELESDDEKDKITQEWFVERLKPSKRQLKRPKLQQVVTSNTALPQTLPLETNTVFEMPESQTSKKIEFKLNLEKANTENDIPTPTETEEKRTEPSLIEGGFGQFTPVAKKNIDEEENKEEPQENQFILSRKEIEENRIDQQEMKKLAVFKNYVPGEVTSRLYIKNLSKQVEEKDLKAIYLYYVNRNDDDEMNRFDIRLMKEGRMKGQAFVTLPNEKKSEDALNATNGYVLHGKPLVVQFARSAKLKDTVQK